MLRPKLQHRHYGGLLNMAIVPVNVCCWDKASLLPVNSLNNRDLPCQRTSTSRYLQHIKSRYWHIPMPGLLPDGHSFFFGTHNYISKIWDRKFHLKPAVWLVVLISPGLLISQVAAPPLGLSISTPFMGCGRQLPFFQFPFIQLVYKFHSQIFHYTDLSIFLRSIQS